MEGVKMEDVNCALVLFMAAGCIAAIGLLLRRALADGGRPVRSTGSGILWLLAGLGGLALVVLIFLVTMDLTTQIPKG